MNFRKITSVNSLTDPSRATDREHVERRARTEQLSPEAFEAVESELEGMGGRVRVGVHHDDSVVLARPADADEDRIDDADDGGWVPITGPVAEGEDWIATAGERAAALVDAEVEVGPVAHVRRIRYEHADDVTRVLEAHEVVVHAEPADDASPDLGAATVDGETWELGAFEKLPAGVPDGDVPDVLPFFE